MLHIYRRHRTKCQFRKTDKVKSCQCALWVKGTIEGAPYQRSLKTRNFDRAQTLARKLEAGAVPHPSLTFQEASATFLKKLMAENRTSDTIRKYHLLFSQLSPIGKSLTDFTFDALLKFQAEWTESPVTRNKKLDRLKAFFRFAHDAGWISKNPARLLDPASVRQEIVTPFSPEEQQIILGKPQTRQLRCFVRILYYSALRISDTCMLRPQDFDGSRIRRANQKRGQVFIPIPPDLKAELDKLPLNGGYYFLQGQSEKHYTQSDAWRTILNGVFKESVPGFHAHRFRHTAAVNWLASGLTMEEVAALLGNSVKVVEKHYASFCPSRQEVLQKKLERTWKPKLVRVK